MDNEPPDQGAYNESGKNAQWLVPDENAFNEIKALPEGTQKVILNIYQTENIKKLAPEQLEVAVKDIGNAAVKDRLENDKLEVVNGIRKAFYVTIATRYTQAAAEAGISADTKAGFVQRAAYYREKVMNMERNIGQPVIDNAPDPALAGGGVDRSVIDRDTFLVNSPEDRHDFVLLEQGDPRIANQLLALQDAAVNRPGELTQGELRNGAEKLERRARMGGLSNEELSFLNEAIGRLRARADEIIPAPAFIAPPEPVRAPSMDRMRPPPVEAYGANASNMDESLQIMREMRDYQKQSAEAQKKSLEYSRQSYEAIVEAEQMLVPLDPIEFQQKPPGWFTELSDSEKNVIRTQLHINFAASRKLSSGNLDACLRPGSIGKDVPSIPIKFNREAIDTMWREMPGYRVAFTTMCYDLFELSGGRTDIPVKLKRNEGVKGGREYFARQREQHMVFSKKGELILGLLKDDEKEQVLRDHPEWRAYAQMDGDMGKYKDFLAQRLEEHITNQGPNRVRGKAYTDVSAQLGAEAAVANAWNLLYVSGAIESADEGSQAIKGPDVLSTSLRSFYQPLDAVKVKMISTEGPQDVNEKWGGPMGDWYLDRLIYSGSFRRQVQKFDGNNHYFPNRLFYSLLDYSQYASGDLKGRSFAQGVLLSNKVWADEQKTLVDFENPNGDVKPGNLRDDELFWRYSARADSARKVYELLTGEYVEKSDFDAGDFCNAVGVIIQNEPWMEPLFEDETMLTGAVAMLALAEAKKRSKGVTGFLLGVNKPIMNVEGELYDVTVDNVLDVVGPRLLRGRSRGMKESIRRNLQANNLNSPTGALRSTLGMGRGWAKLRSTLAQTFRR